MKSLGKAFLILSVIIMNITFAGKQLKQNNKPKVSSHKPCTTLLDSYNKEYNRVLNSKKFLGGFCATHVLRGHVQTKTSHNSKPKKKIKKKIYYHYVKETEHKASKRNVLVDNADINAGNIIKDNSKRKKNVV